MTGRSWYEYLHPDDLAHSAVQHMHGVYFTARRYASAVYTVVVCPSVRLSVRLSQAVAAPKWLNVGLCK